MILNLIYKSLRKAIGIVTSFFERLYCIYQLKGNGVKYKNFRTSGIPYIMVARGGKCTIGKGFAMNNGIKGNPIGCYQRCTLFVDRNAELVIGDYVGMSQAALVCKTSITIGNYVKLGGGVCIYDTDFHSLNSEIRKSKKDIDYCIKKPVTIKDNAFIGAHSIILKGVTIGENSIVGAGSVVTKSIPANQIWGGNPAKFIKSIE